MTAFQFGARTQAPTHKRQKSATIAYSCNHDDERLRFILQKGMHSKRKKKQICDKNFSRPILQSCEIHLVLFILYRNDTYFKPSLFLRIYDHPLVLTILQSLTKTFSVASEVLQDSAGFNFKILVKKQDSDVF